MGYSRIAAAGSRDSSTGYVTPFGDSARGWVHSPQRGRVRGTPYLGGVAEFDALWRVHGAAHAPAACGRLEAPPRQIGLRLVVPRGGRPRPAMRVAADGFFHPAGQPAEKWGLPRVERR